MEDSNEESVSKVSNGEPPSQKGELSSNRTIPSGILPCADYMARAPGDYTSQLYQAKPYTHILSVPVSETIPAYAGQTQYQSLQPSQPYTVYPQATQTYGLPPFGALWPGVKSENGLIQTLNSPTVLTCSSVTNSQTSSVLYSYPVQASTTNAISSTSPTNITTPTVTSISNQEYPTYTILGQNQYQHCYPNQNFTTVSPPGPTESNPVTPDFQERKTDSTSPLQIQTPISGDPAAGQPMRAMRAKKQMNKVKGIRQ